MNIVKWIRRALRRLNNWIKRLKFWLRRRRRSKAIPHQNTELREFVYLDEVSVYSLLASRLGPIAAEFTENEKASLKAELSGTGGSVDVGSQVVRKSIIQTTFKDLYDTELELHSFTLRPIDTRIETPQIKTIRDIELLQNRLLREGWLIDPSRLLRGQLLEMEVQLEAEETFQVSAVISALIEMFRDDSEILKIDPYSFKQGHTLGLILEKLLNNLVPIRGFSVDYEILEIRGYEWIIHSKILNQLSNADTFRRLPLYLVGVAEQSLFWKDVRRILFERLQFRALCRLSTNGLQESWTPVKLSNALNQVIPELGNQVDDLGSNILASLHNSGKVSRNDINKQKAQIEKSLLFYARLIANYHTDLISDEELYNVIQCLNIDRFSFDNQQQRNEAFASIANLLDRQFSWKPDNNMYARLRELALEQAGLDFTGKPLVENQLSNNVSTNLSSEERFLNAEFIAIYW